MGLWPPGADRLAQAIAPACATVDNGRPKRVPGRLSLSTFYLHIGMNKTGSSAVQVFCFRNRERLREAGLAYSNLPFPNHSDFLDSQFSAEPDRIASRLLQHGNAVFLNQREALRRAWERDLAELAGSGHDALMSAETASLLAPSGLDALGRVLRRHFDRVVVLGLVRPPSGFLRSSMQQSLKGGNTFATLPQALPMPRYRRRFEPHRQVFGAENVRLRLFRADRLVDGCVLQTVLAMMDGDRSSLAGMRAERVNESMSLTGAKLLSALNATLRARAFSSSLPPAVVGPLREGVLGEFFETAFAQAGLSRSVPRPLLRAAVALSGPRFALPFEFEVLARERGAADDDWIGAILGEDVRDYPDAPDAMMPTFADCFAFTGDEVDRIVAALETVNAQTRQPLIAIETRTERQQRRRAQEFVAGTGARPEEAAEGRRGQPPAGPPAPRSIRWRLARAAARLWGRR